MKGKGNMKLGTKLLVAFLAVGVIPFAVIGGVSYVKSSNALKQQAFNQLTMAREIKKAQIEKYFEERKGDMGVLAETVGTLRSEAFNKLIAVQTIKKNQIQNYFGERLGDVSVLSGNDTVTAAIEAFEAGFEAGGDQPSGPGWSAAATQYAPWLTQYNNEYGYYDLFLIHADGDVIYTVAQESDLGQNLVDGPLKDSPLGKCFRKALAGVALQDFAPYAPSDNEPCAFVGAPVKKGDQVIGVVALQLPLGAINKIMQERAGLGETGECYLVGPDKRMRSDSFLDPVGHTVKASFAGSVKDNGCDTAAARNALGGKSGAEVILDYNGNPVLSAYAPITVGDLTWAVLAEQDVAEAFCPKDEKGQYYFAKYTEMYGYYDLFLINPDGYCFYTVAQEADYQTNFLNGKYQSSNLGKLVNQTLQTKGFGFADFAPYAPSNNEPCAFVAQPVVHNGKIELIVALQLSLGAINSIMQQREGMGKSGETYLVGTDYRMRSDSFLDSENYSVAASFGKNNLAKSTMIEQALQGNDGILIEEDYTGTNNIVLSAYAPTNVFGTRWALIAEINDDEALAAVIALRYAVGIVAIISIVAIVLLALWITRSITKPINNVIAGLTQGAEQVTSASGQVAASSQSMAEGASEQASSLEETSASLEEMSSMTKQNAENATQANTMSGQTSEAATRGQEAMKRMSDAINKIKASSDETAKIIKTIDEIAFQTNLLALNAAVEAARAGDAGKGFAVVAEEVRNLAQRSAEAAKNTSALIEESQQNADNGVSVSQEVAEILSQIGEGVQRVTQLIGEVNAASKEQAQGIEQINTAVSQMDQVTQSNAANSEEAASASEELSAQAHELNEMVSVLVAIVGGSNGDGSTAGAAARRSTSPRLTHKAQGRPETKALTTSTPRKQQSHGGADRVVKPQEVIPLDDDDLGDF